MADLPRSSFLTGVAVHLLDPVQGYPVQTWRFASQGTITIGRDDKNDVVIADPHVSRAHVTLTQSDGFWLLSSIGRHGTIVNDRLISDTVLQHRSVFRLGAAGPMFRFDTHEAGPKRSETMDDINPDTIAMLEIDEQRKKEEVDRIVDDPLFQELREKSRRQKEASQETM